MSAASGLEHLKPFLPGLESALEDSEVQAARSTTRIRRLDKRTRGPNRDRRRDAGEHGAT